MRASMAVVLGCCIALLFAHSAEGQCLGGAQCDYGAEPEDCGCDGNLPVSQCGQATPEPCDASISYPLTGHVCSGSGCNGLRNCRNPEVPLEPEIEVVVEPDGQFTARLVFDVVARWNQEAGDQDLQFDNSNGTLQILWFASGSLCSGTVGSCNYRASDRTRTYLEKNDLTCAGAPYDFGTYSIRVQTCQGEGPCPFLFPLSCGREVDRVGKAFVVTAEDLGCPVPPPERCKGDASCESCPGGNSIGGGGAAAGGPGGPGDPQSGRGAYLYYTAGGAGAAGLPGSAAWNVALGRHWSHDYAQRIVEDPLELDPPESRVHLITEYGTYRTFFGLVGGVYTEVSPSDEYRTLEHTAMGWTLTDLDGTVTEFDAAGLWRSTTDRNDNAKTAVYDTGRLAEVHFPDQRKELFAYHDAPDPAEGKLASITEVGIDGATTREWRYFWSGENLVGIERPDGTAVEYFYDTTHAGYLTRVELVGDDGTSRRIERAWEYDEDGRVEQAWSGALDPLDGVDRWQYSYDSDTQTTVTDPLGKPITYTYDRDPASRKVRVREIEGDCPSCGLGPNSQLTYGDAANPLLPTSVVDANGHETAFTYETNGQVRTRTDAASTAEARTTTYEYDHPTIHGLVTEISAPSVMAGQLRRTLLMRDGSGNVTDREIRGWEAGVPFDCTVTGAPCYVTVTEYNAQGQPETIDPPGYGTDDLTTLMYDPARNFLVAANRTDPKIGTTTFGHDAYNRRTSMTDPNGVTTETRYDELDRVTMVIQEGATPAEDLVSEHRYSPFGDLERTILPRGNLIEYVYEEATGRLAEIRRWSATQTQGERVRYELDPAGNRTREEHQRWDANLGNWGPIDAVTGYLYTTRCQLDQVLHPDGSITEHAYDCNGNLERTWDANHPSALQTAPPTTTYGYDELDRLETVTRPWAGAGGGTSVTSYDYDVQDHLTGVTDAEGNTTSYEYSDRDLLTEETSPVSGTTTHLYNPHGELIQTTDARLVTVTRMIDELDRVTFLDFPDPTLDTTYTYDDPLVPFSKGRLTGIERDGHTIAYAYDRFGRTTQDGELTYGHDANGNVTTIGYPGDVTATYGFDFADRQETLTVSRPASTLPAEVTPVVTSATYLPSGPLTSLTFGTGAVESHGYDTRYLPAAIGLDAAEDRTWIYTNDDVGNVTEIMAMAACAGNVVLSNHTVVDAEEIFESCAELEAGPDFNVAAGAKATLRAATRVVLKNGFRVESGGRLEVGTDPDLSGNVTKTYDYQDIDYFLTSADGPWGSQSWTYDKIGNRVTETRDGATDTYHYVLNGTGGNTVELASIDLSTLGTRDYGYTMAGHVDDVTAGANVVDFAWDDAGRLAASTRPASGDSSPFFYDGRGFLRSAGDAATAGTVSPTYDSAGLLYALLREPAGDPTRRYSILYLAGRPVAQLAAETGQPDRWWYLTTDHLGTPLVATDAAQAELWKHRFEPFGTDPWANTSAGALENEMFLRFPGQWEDEVWQEAMLGAEGYYNVYRWYTPGTGRYTRLEPVQYLESTTHYLYAFNSPLTLTDPRGLAPTIPPGAKPCFSLDPPSCCSGDGLSPRAQTVRRLKSLYCANKDKPRLEPKPRPGSSPLVQIGGIIPEPWYRPQGNPCVDRCICAHEELHVWQTSGGRRGWSVNQLECEGYGLELRCLGAAERLAEPLDRPFIPALPIF
jgi:RHS repeat-associated protein